ncbi:MAG: flagellar type III secretion system pore protein FliP [Candidatus Hydrogenedentes bacterium]|nr:flagellar type III secretion system pore protein FliP [Candidatus Hydrogenedentota bacterium]
MARSANRIALLLPMLLLALPAIAQEEPSLGRQVLGAAQEAANQENISTSLTVVFLMTVLSLAPAILVMTTSFTRIIVVLGFLRQAMATQQTPPNQVLLGLALFLTFFIMMPTYKEMNDTAIQPYIRGEFTSQWEALDAAIKPVRDFMFRQTRPKDIVLFLNIADLPRPETRDDVPTEVLIPAFVISELTKAFTIGFVIYIPFLIIDMVVASTLMAMGMMMLPPIFVSLPFKIIMFVLADGWYLLLGTLTESFN